MQLQGINVLVDGYNLEQKQGTGIKTYGNTLIQALMSLGVNVDILCSRYSNSRNSLVKEALFFDIQKNGSKISKTKNILLALSQIFYQAKEIEVSNFVIKQDYDFIFEYVAKSGKVFNVYECYEVANYLYKIFCFESKVILTKRIDIWHTTYPLPLKINKSKKVTTIHDLVPLKLPYATLDNKSFFFNVVKKSIKDSEIILTISENTKKDILECFDIHPDKIKVTYQPITPDLQIVSQDTISNFLKKYRLKFKQYILFVGAIEPKKNVGRLIDAYAGLDTEIHLVIVGKKGWLWEDEIGKLEVLFGKNFSRKVKLMEYVPKQDLIYLYKGAFCFVFPSLYEGFGLPPLEAMSFGCPVITSNVSSLPEVCGDAALYVDPYNSDEIREAIAKLIDNPLLVQWLINAAKERVKLFSMENYATKLYEAYTKII